MSPAGATSPNRLHVQRLNALLSVATLAVVSLMGYLIWSGYREAVRGAGTTTRNYAAILDARLDATLRRADADLLERVRTIPVAALSKRAVPRHARAIDATLDSHMAHFSELAGLRIFDADGDMLYTSASASTPRTHISDRDYFRRLRDDPQAGLVFSEVVTSRATGRPSMAVARALRDGQGAFRGIVSAVIELEYFKELFQSLEIGPGGFIAFVRSDDFRMVLRHPPLANWLNRALPPGTAMRDAVSAGNRHATLDFTSGRTGIEGIASVRVLGRYPFYVTAALGRRDVLQGWLARTQAVGAAGLLLFGLLAGLLVRHRRAEVRESRAMSDLMDSEERFRTLFEQAAVGVALAESATSRIVRVNRKFADFLGYSQEEMLQQSFRSFTHADDLPLTVALRERLESGEVSDFNVEKRYIRKDGSVVWGNLTVSPIRKADGSFDHQVAVVTDITERKRAEELLRESEARLSGVFRASPIGIGVTRIADGKTLDINDAALRLHGYRREEMIGRTAAELGLYADPSQRAELVERLRNDGHVEKFPVDMRSRSGEVRAVELSAQTLDLNGERCLVAMTVDVSERERQEAALIAARQAAEDASLAKTRFLAAASHDLRQPIQAVNLFLGAMNRTRLSEDQKEICGYLSTAVSALGDLLSGLLDISKLDAGIVKPHLRLTDTEDVLLRIKAEFAPMATEKNLHFRLFLRRKGLALRTDPDLLLRILRNIVGNALKYSEHGGILVGARRRGDRGVIQVWDTGIGMAPGHMRQIFEEYFQIGNPERDRTQGLGLGLAIVSRLAKLIDGEIECRSRLGRGTVFEISLPLADGPLNGDKRLFRHASKDPDNSSGLRGRRIVVIEDDVLVAKAIEKSLGALGMKVTAFDDAEDALASLEIADADFYISDFRLPGRFDGVQLLNAIQQRSAKPISAVLLTGDTSPTQIDLSTCSNWNVLFKPVDLSKLLSMMTETTGLRGGPERRKHRP